MSTVTGLDKLGLSNIGKVFHNLSYEELFEHEVKNNEGRVSNNSS